MRNLLIVAARRRKAGPHELSEQDYDSQDCEWTEDEGCQHCVTCGGVWSNGERNPPRCPLSSLR